MTNTNRMKRFQWKWALVAPVLALGMVACEEPDPTDEPGGSYPSDNISVASQQQIAITEITAADCGTCPPTQEITEVLKTLYPGRIVPMSLQAGDTLYTPFMNDIYLTLGDDMSNTFKFFINGVQLPPGVNPYEQIQIMIDADIPPIVGVGHATRENDTAWLIYPAVHVYADNQRDLYVQSYVMLDNVVAKAYGSVDVTQASADPRIQAGTGGNPTTWTSNGGQVDSATYLYSPGDPYMHHDVTMFAGVNDTNVYGLPLSIINPLGQNYLNGDIFGNQYTPIEISVPKPDFDIASHVEADLKVVTVVWERVPGAPDVYTYVNGYYSAF